MVLDVALFGVLALFIYFGHRWAILCAMALWTIEKAAFIVQGFGPAHPGPGMAVGQVIWWAAYMHAFYFAFRVEQERKGRSDTAAARG